MPQRCDRLCRVLPLAFALAALTAAMPSRAVVVGSATPVDFSGGSTSFGFGGATFTLSDNLSGFPDPVSIATLGGAEVRTIFGQPSVDFQTFIVYNDDPFLQFGSFASPTPMRFSATPSSLGLRVQASDGAHFGYALFSGTLLQSFGFETAAGVGIVSGAPITAAVPEPASYALMLAGLAGVAGWMRRGRNRLGDGQPAREG